MKGKMHKSINNRKAKSSILGIVIALLASTAFQERSFAQCSYDPVQIICHDAFSITNTGCCFALAMYCLFLQHHYPATNTRHGTEGRTATCGVGTTAASIGDPFEGTCAWSEWGVTCNTPWGPVPTTGPVTLRNCIGSCHGGG